MFTKHNTKDSMPKHVKDLLTNILPKQNSWKLFLLQEWDTIVGDLKIQIRLEKIQTDTLILGVSNSSWMQELFCLSDFLIEKINAKLEFPYVKKLRFKYSAPLRKKSIHQITASSIATPNIILTTAQQKQLESIEDEHLRTALKNFLIRCHYNKFHLN